LSIVQKPKARGAQKRARGDAELAMETLKKGKMTAAKAQLGDAEGLQGGGKAN